LKLVRALLKGVDWLEAGDVIFLKLVSFMCP